MTDLLPSKKSVKDETRIRQLVARQGIGLGHAAGVGVTGRAEGGVHDVVSGAVGRAPGVLVAHIGERGVREVVLSTSGLIWKEIMNQVDVHILKAEIRTRELSLSGMEAARTHFNGRVFQSRSKLSLRETREGHENLLQLGKPFQFTNRIGPWGGRLTSIFRSSMALGSLRTSMRAAIAEYSMLKGRPVLPSLSSLMAFVELSSLWKGRSGRGWRRVHGLYRTPFGI